MKITIRGKHILMTDELRDRIENRVSLGLRRFARWIDTVHVNLTDVNGPKGGIDRRCMLMVVLHPRGLVMGTADGETSDYAVGRAVDRVVRRLKVRRKKRLAKRAPVGT